MRFMIAYNNKTLPSNPAGALSWLQHVILREIIRQIQSLFIRKKSCPKEYISISTCSPNLLPDSIKVILNWPVAAPVASTILLKGELFVLSSYIVVANYWRLEAQIVLLLFMIMAHERESLRDKSGKGFCFDVRFDASLNQFCYMCGVWGMMLMGMLIY